MKIALICNSILLKKSLEIFLKEYLCSYKVCDFVISDKQIDIQKPLFIIGTDLKLPFSKSSLILKLDKFYKKQKRDQNPNDLKELEKKIEEIINNFKDEILDAIKEWKSRS
jgi:hypothetical protein